MRGPQKSSVFGEIIKDASFKQGKKVGYEDMVAALDRMYDKKYPVIPNARVHGAVQPTHKMIANSEHKIRRIIGGKGK